MTDRNDYHVSFKFSRWKVHLAGSFADRSAHRDKDEAVSAAAYAARRRPPSRVVVHWMNGRVEREFTYGAELDPC